MAKAEPKHESESGGKKGGKKHLHQVITTKAKDNSYVHEHVYKKHPDDHHSEPPVFAGTSQNMEDLQQHMQDHFGGGDEQAEGGAPAGGAGAPAAGGEEPGEAA